MSFRLLKRITAAKSMRPYLRLAGLLNLARLRSAGVVPWVLFASWMLLARTQEPERFRFYGIHLLRDAAWVGGMLVLVVLLLAVERQPKTASRTANLILLTVIGVIQSGLALCLDAHIGPTDWLGHARSFGSFVLAWSPLAMALAAPGVRPTMSSLVVMGAFAMGCVNSVALRTQNDTCHAVGSSLLAIAAAYGWSTRLGRIRK